MTNHYYSHSFLVEVFVAVDVAVVIVDDADCCCWPDRIR